jgi:hypothetical protein
MNENEENIPQKPDSEGNQILNNSVQILNPASLTKRLSYVFESLVRRIDAFDLLEKRIAELENELILHEFPEEFEKKLDLYERYTKIHLSYIEALRRVVGQIDLEELSRAAGLVSVFQKFKNLSPESIQKVNLLLEKIGNFEDELL